MKAVSYSEAGGMPKSLSVLTVRQFVLVCVCALILPSAASARAWTAKVVSVNDGDTIHVRLNGQVKTVRVSSIQAMEQSVYSPYPSKRRGQCHALEATARLEQLIRAGHGRVRLSAQNASSHAGYRLRRSVAARIGGRWRDLGQILIREGHALWMSGTTEDRWNGAYNEAEQRARLDGAGLWNPTHCGRGPEQDVPLRLWVSSDPVGKDTDDVNGEFIKIRNQGSAPVALAHWWVRDSMLRRFTFPAGTVLAPGRTVTVHVGRGTDTAEAFYWGFGAPVFENSNGDGRNLGDGGYLFDPQGDLRAAMVYPCLVACSDPNQGAVQVSAHPRRAESFAVRNVSDHAVDLYGYELALPGSTYDFGDWPPLAPGETLQVDVNGDPAQDTALRRHWGLGRMILPDPGGVVRLQTFTDITLSCDAWGSGSC
jgi:endonuclease YncB( thermonuclease family)